MTLESKKKWVFPKKTEGGLIETILKKRKIKDIKSFLNPDIKEIPDSSNLADAKAAAKKILETIKANKKIVIHGDFDADGIGAVSLLWEFLYQDLAKHLEIKTDVIPYIPRRIDQGYGLTESSVNEMLEMKTDLVITVDCGVRDKELIQKYMKETDLEFIITDHHQPPEDILEDLNYPLVHQMYPGKEYPNTEICGAAVVFLLIQEIKKQAKMDYEITENTKGLDLVALTTVTDIMPLTGVNRIFVKYGLEQMRKGNRLGLKQLSLVTKNQPEDLQSYHLGFVLGPRINAAGRIGDPLEAVRLMVSKQEKQCKDIAYQLNNMNFDRQQMTTEVLTQSRVDADLTQKLIFVLGNQWHEGIVGLVAGKLQEEFYKPVIVATRTETGEIRGSARSIKGFNITDALEKNEKLLEKYGGHELAAGFTIKKGKEEELQTALENFANENIDDAMLVPEVKVDLLLDTDTVDFKLVEELKQLEPFGYGNSKPTIAIKEAVVVRKNIMGKEGKHMKLSMKGGGIELLDVIMFNCEEDVEKINENDVLNILGYPNINVWNGNESLQFIAKEWKFQSRD